MQEEHGLVWRNSVSYILGNREMEASLLMAASASALQQFMPKDPRATPPETVYKCRGCGQPKRGHKCTAL